MVFFLQVFAFVFVVYVLLLYSKLMRVVVSQHLEDSFENENVYALLAI